MNAPTLRSSYDHPEVLPVYIATRFDWVVGAAAVAAILIKLMLAA